MTEKFIKTEIKRSNKEKRRCKKLYSDWKDDQYNCGPLKFVWGVNSNGQVSDNFYELNDIQIVFNRDTNKYMLDIDTSADIETDTRLHLHSLLTKFTQFISDKLDNTVEPLRLSVYGNGELFQSESLTELYYKFKLFVKGYENL